MGDVLGVIPARFGSSRLPGKPLVMIGDLPMIEWVARGMSEACTLDQLVIATDDDRIREVAEGYGRTVVMTSPDLISGTDRVAVVARDTDCDIIINVQGDEPLIRGTMIDSLVEVLAGDATLPMASLGHQMSEEEADDPNVVKVVTDIRGRALYFSRSRIPWVRRRLPEGARPWIRHIGIYGYRRDFLLRFATLPPGRLEQLEGLEQLRALENGYPIRIVTSKYNIHGVDTPEDLQRVREELE
jgi:3-deoxy-manno-octulosonate cytidylyltransferase (CMP-KDO synthetase)